MRRALMLAVLRTLLWSSPGGAARAGARRKAPSD